MKKVEGKERSALAAFARLAGFFAFFLGFGVIMPAALPGQARADVPVKFTYQGNLRQSGFLVNGTRSMVFRIYDSSSSTTDQTPSEHNIRRSPSLSFCWVISGWTNNVVPRDLVRYERCA